MQTKGDTIVCEIMHYQFCFTCGKHLATAKTGEETEQIVKSNGGTVRKDSFYRAYCASHVPANTACARLGAG